MALNDVDACRYPNTSRWYKHIGSLNEDIRNKFPPTLDEAKKQQINISKHSVADEGTSEDTSSSDDSSSDSEDDDSSSDSNSSSSESETEEQRKERLEKEEKKRKYDEKIARNIAKEQSNVVFDINPSDTDVNLEDIVANIRKIQCEGLLWGVNYEIIPIAFGLKKIRIGSTITNVLVSTDWMQDELEAIPGVSSTEIIAFQKI